jgi:hypothetical protein
MGWRYCDDWGQLARFYVMLDGTTKKVRTTNSQQEAQAPESALRGGGSFMCAK